MSWIPMFILGIALGIALHRLLMAFVLMADPDTKCAYCAWLHRGRCRYKWLTRKEDRRP